PWSKTPTSCSTSRPHTTPRSGRRRGAGPGAGDGAGCARTPPVSTVGCHIHHRRRRRTRHAVVIEELQEASDGALVLAIARYQQPALAEAYRRHGGAVFALARRLLGEQALAEEVVQEVFLRLWTQPDRFDADRGTLR